MVLCVGKLAGTGKANGPGYPERLKRLKLSGAEGRYRSIRYIFEINNPRDIDKLDIYC